MPEKMTRGKKKAFALFNVGPDKSSRGKKKAAGKKPAGKKQAGRDQEEKIRRTKTPYTHRPEGMSVEEWQIALRREYGEAQKLRMKNLGTEPFFSEFLVENPESGGKYRVAIRGAAPGGNYCSCPDFAVNTLGTCKHVEFVLSRLTRKRGAAQAFAAGHLFPYSSVYLKYGAERKVMFKPGTECPDRLREIAGGYFDAAGRLTAEGFFGFDRFLKDAGEIGHEVRCYEDAVQYIARVRDQARLREAVDRDFAEGEDSPALNGLLKTTLYPYQKKGALFAARAGRAVLADDMGLGKTVQALAAAEILARAAGIERVLLICPASLKHQWKSEIEKFTGRSALVVEGPLLTRRRLYREESFFKIINYEMVPRDGEQLREWAPDLIILDEAQRIKNWKTRTAQSVKKLESPYALVLTGTPLENRLEELHSIVEFVDRFHLGPRFRFLHDHQKLDEDGVVVGYKDLGKIHQTLAPILLRRTKAEVLTELPERMEKKFFVPMTQEQMDIHEENRDTVTRLVAKWRRYHYLSETEQRILMAALQNMRMACNSTYLLDRQTDFGCKADELVTLLGEIFEDPETKAVVFSQWLGTHELIIRRLNGNGWGYSFLHGGVPSPKRKDLIQRFRDDPKCRLFLSTETGGVGMNLQNASVIISMDLPWNPAVLEQRIGRVHRLGQRRPVRVVNFIAHGTIEHGMLSLLDFKKSLFAGVLDGGQDEVFLGGSRLKRFMETVERASGNIPEAPAPEPAPVEMPEAAEQTRAPEQDRPAGATLAEQAWGDVISAGLSLFEKLGQALGASPDKAGAATGKAADLLVFAQKMVERDEAGRTYLKIPAPPADALRKIADALYQISGPGKGGMDP